MQWKTSICLNIKNHIYRLNMNMILFYLLLLIPIFLVVRLYFKYEGGIRKKVDLDKYIVFVILGCIGMGLTWALFLMKFLVIVE